MLLMQKPPEPANEHQRLDALERLNILDTPPEERFDHITRIAARIFDVPIALVSLVDQGRQWFKSAQGLHVRSTSRDISFCGHAILQDGILEITDAVDDPRFMDNPLVTADPNIRFYAGCPIRTASGLKIGTLCLIDRSPKELSAEEKQQLVALAAKVEQELSDHSQASVNPVSQLSSKRAFLELAPPLLDACRQRQSSGALIQIKLANIAEIEAHQGRRQSRQALEYCSEIIRDVMSDGDLIAHLDEQRFAVLYTQLSRESIQVRLRQLNQAIDTFRPHSNRDYRIQSDAVSVAWDRPSSSLNIQDLMQRCDALWEDACAPLSH